MDDEPVAIKLGSVSVEWVEADPGPCVICQREVGTGPVGFTLDGPDGPLCDGCLLEANKDLGMMMMMAHVVRELATAAEENTASSSDPWRADEIMLSLMLFAKVYNQGAEWTRRPIAAREFTAELQKSTSKMPITVILRALLGDRR